MVDTPRTLAELLTIFADNSSGAISAQDLRDALVSITNPVEGGGFPATWRSYLDDHLSYTYTTPTVKQSLASSTGVTLVMDPAVAAANVDSTDPMGSLHEGPWDYYGNQPEWSTFRLPVGLWAVNAHIVLDSTSTTGKRALSVVALEESWEVGAGPEPVFGDPLYMALAFGSMDEQQSGGILVQGAQQAVARSAIVVSPPTGTAPGGGTMFGLFAFQNSGSPMTVDYVRLRAVRIG